MILVLFFLLPFLNLTLVIFNYYTSKISSQYLFYEIDNHTNNVYNIFITSVRFKEGFEMSDLPQISEAEFEVMKIVWKHAPISTNEITDKLLQTTSWSPKTIQTLIKRLVTKGVLTYEKQSRVFVYTPVVKESEYIGQESNSFLERYYDGDITAMLSAYIENDRLSETEIDTLRSLLSKRHQKEAINVANFMIRFLICNVFISGIIGILLIAKQIFKNNLSSRMQYNLWFLLLGLLAVPFIPFRLIGFPQIFSWLGSLRCSPASGTATAMGEAVGINPTGNTDWMNDFSLSVNSETPSIAGYILLGIWIVGILQ